MTTDRAPLAVNAWNADYIEAQYQRWQADPESVEPQWRDFFAGFDLGVRLARPEADGRAAPPAPPVPGAAEAPEAPRSRPGRIHTLIARYRSEGHFAADLDPLGVERPMPRHLTPESLGFTDTDLSEAFDPGTLPLSDPASLRDIVDLLRDTYCRHVGVEYMYIQDRDRRRWLQKRMEPVRNRPKFPAEHRLRILHELMEADAFESFLDVRYKGKKRFALDGGEALNPMLNEIIDRCPEHGIKELTIGMAHRGRLNVLANIMNKTYDQIFTEFEESWVEDFLEGGGDVKYHRGYSADNTAASGDVIRMTLSPNPSHLEYVNPVVLGRARAKQRIRKDAERSECVPILIHGDAAFPAQGVVAEALNFSQLDGYTVGGAVHIIINNQIGFTTDQKDAHSGHYCTDIAKMIEAPIFHVNGDDPEACAYVAALAIEYRQTFKRDVVIDMWCYRRYGHNEGDEPTFTQPLMYQRIKKKKRVYELYVDRLVNEGVIERAEVDRMYEQLRTRLDESQTRTKDNPVEPNVRAFRNVWAGHVGRYHDEPVETKVSHEALMKVSEALGRTPEGFNTHRKLSRLLSARGSAVRDGEHLDWGMGEMLAYGTLLLENYDVRLTGQDVERGTFSHRHAVLFDQQTGEGYISLNHIAEQQGRFCIHNSPLTESACVGFEYGYSLGDPNMLVIWEAQFGDFANGAQVYFDQFIASAEAKWKRFSGLTLFLPHSYEGQGPEHSSARLERFLTLCANNNMQVVYPTTPAQHFHLLRRQMKRNFRKPLIVMTPKSLLRHPKATSTIAELTGDRFHHVLDDPAVTDPKRVKRLIFCTGKVYYDLVAHREKAERDDVAIVRLEQLYPLRAASIEPALKRYAHAEKVWVQEEPRNMGAWRYMQESMRELFDLNLPYIGREANSSPAVASYKMHVQEQEKIMIAAVGLPTTHDAQADSDETSSHRGRRDQPTTASQEPVNVEAMPG